MKGLLAADHIPINNFEMLIVGMTPMVITEVSGIEEELQTTDLPDRTSASGGNTMPVEFTAKSPMHHTVDQAQMELWFSQCQDPVSVAYKRAGTLIHKSISGETLRTFSLLGLYPTKRSLPDLDMANEGECAFVEWTFKADQVLPI
jgi:hypothetical protein